MADEKSDPSAAPDLELTAFQVSAQPLPLRPAPARRDWMDVVHEHAAYRCLPMVIANQIGWELLCPVDFVATWDGGDCKESLRIQFDRSSSDYVSSHFGNGILTFSPGYLFRTPQGYNLWCKGPANDPKDGIAPLEGIVETDWSPYPFTMNWKFTRKDHFVMFRKGEPICSILPIPRDLPGRIDPVVRPITADPEAERGYRAWTESRARFNQALLEPGTDARRLRWQKHYMLGLDAEARPVAVHESKLQIRPFRKADDQKN